MVEPGFSPRVVALLHQLFPRPPVDAGERGRAGEFEQARGDVDGEHLLFDDFRGGDGRQAGETHDLHDADAGLMRGALVHHAVLAVEDAVVAHENDDGVVQFAARAEPFVEAAHAVIDRENRAPIGARHRFEVLHCGGRVVGKFLPPIEERPVDAVPGVEPLADPGGFVIEHERGLRIGHVDGVEGLFVFRLGEVETVWCFVADHHEPGLAVPRPGEPLLRHVGDDGGVVAFNDLALLAVEIEFGVEVFSLPFVGHEPVEAGARIVIVLTHVPFAKIGGVIPGGLQHCREAFQLGGILSEVIGHAMSVGVEPAQDARAARRAERRRAKRVFKMHAFPPETIDVRSFEVLVAGEAERVPALVVGQDEENIGRAGRGGESAGGEGYGENAEE